MDFDAPPAPPPSAPFSKENYFSQGMAKSIGTSIMMVNTQAVDSEEFNPSCFILSHFFYCSINVRSFY